MAARTRRGTSASGWDESVRERIKTSMLVNRLTNHALGSVEMSPTQVRAAEILLSKTLPSLTSTALTVSDKRDASDWSRDELVAFLHDASAGSERAASANGRGAKPDQVH